MTDDVRNMSYYQLTQLELFPHLHFGEDRIRWIFYQGWACRDYPDVFRYWGGRELTEEHIEDLLIETTL